MKLKALHLFLILFVSLLLCTVTCCKNIENYENKSLHDESLSFTGKAKDYPYNNSGLDTRQSSNFVDNAGYSNQWNAKQKAINQKAPRSDEIINPLSIDSGGIDTYEAPYQPPPKGINRSQIQEGDDGLYILKSQIVPPVCPVCPSNTYPRQEQCPACPACERCPEPAFECKKVPNYSSGNNQYLPRAVLNDFSQFGS